MMHAEIKPFTVDDPGLFVARAPEARIDAELGGAIRFAHAFAQYPSWTAYIDGQAAFSAGFVPYWPGVAEVWARTSDLVESYPLYFHKTMRTYLESTVKAIRLWRVHAEVQEDNERSQKWLEALGFGVEGTLWHFGPAGEHFLMYAKYYPEHRLERECLS